MHPGGDTPGQRRIDDAGDFVRLEVAVALESGARVVPVILPGAEMPSTADLPVARGDGATQCAQPEQRELGSAYRPAVQAIGLPRRRRVWPWALGGAAIAAAAATAIGALGWPKSATGV